MNKIWFNGNTALDTENPTCEQELKSFCFEVIEPDNLRDIITYNPDGIGAVDTLDFDESETAITLNGATYSNGRLGQGLSFDGNATAVISGTNASSPTRELTIEAWLRPQSLSGTYVIEKAGSYAFPKFNADGSITAKLKIANTETTITTPANTAGLSIWKHYVLTYNGSVIKIYVNGTEKASLATSGSISSNFNDIVLGSGFTGKLDELNIFGRALSASEISAKYASVPNLVDCNTDILNHAEPILSGFKKRRAMRSNGYVSGERRRSRAKVALPFGNGHFCPIAASLALNVAFATPADSFVALGSKLAIHDSIYQCYSPLAPSQPTRPKLPESGDVYKTYYTTFTAWDLDGDNIKYVIDWGDGGISTTTLVSNGSVICASHSWVNGTTEGIDYAVRIMDMRDGVNLTT